MEPNDSSLSAEWTTAIITAIGLLFVWWQIRQARSTTKNQFLLQLHETFRNYDKVNQKLSTNDHWSPPDDGEPNWLDVYSYLGLFERISIMVDSGQMKLDGNYSGTPHPPTPSPTNTRGGEKP